MHPSLFDPPEEVLPASEAHARNTDPWTSHAAARSIAEEKLRKSQEAVLDAFRRYGPFHDEEFKAIYRGDAFTHGWPAQSDSGLRTRRKELVRAGFLADSGDTVILPSGRKSIVWETTDPRSF